MAFSGMLCLHREFSSVCGCDVVEYIFILINNSLRQSAKMKGVNKKFDD